MYDDCDEWTNDTANAEQAEALVELEISLIDERAWTW